MSKTNDPKQSDNTSSSTIRNLFRQNTDETPSSAVEQNNTADQLTTPERSDQNHTPELQGNETFEQKALEGDKKASKRQGRGFFSDFKSKWNRFLNSMKQQPEAEQYEDEEEVEEFAEEIDTDFRSFKESYKKPDDSKRESKVKEKPGFFKKFRLEAFEEGTEEEYILSEEQKPSAKKQHNSIKQPDRKSAGTAAHVSSRPTEQTVNLSETKPEESSRVVKEFVLSVTKPEHHQKTSDKKTEVALSESKETAKQEKEADESVTSVDTQIETSVTEPEDQRFTEKFDPAAAKEESKKESVPEINSNSNLIYSAPIKRQSEQPSVKAPEKDKEADSEQKTSTDKYSKELPAFDIFAEFAKEQKMKGKEQEGKNEVPESVTAARKAVNEITKERQEDHSEKGIRQESDSAAAKESAELKKEEAINDQSAQTASDKEENRKDDTKTVSDSPDSIEKTKTPGEQDSANSEKTQKKPDDEKSVAKDDKADTAVDEGAKSADTAVKKEKTEVSKFQADDLPGGDGITIIPWGSANTKAGRDNLASENLIYDAPLTEREEETEKDLTEGHLSAVTYHYSSAAPLVVMAGKFSGTLRTEYETARRYRTSGMTTPVKKQPTQSAPVGQENAKTVSKPIKTGSIPVATVVSSQKANSDKAPASVSSNQKAKRKRKNTPLIDLEQYEEVAAVKEQPTIEKEQNNSRKQNKKKRFSRFDKQKQAKEKQARRKYRFKDLFGSEDEFDPDDIDIKENEPKPQLDDYNEEKDAEAIKTEISSNFQSVFARVFVLLATSAASVILSLIAQCSGLFRETIRNGWLWYALISFLLLGVSVVVSRSPIVNGIMPLKRFKGNSDTAVAVASLAGAMQNITALFTPDVYVSGNLYLYTPLVIIALFLNAVGKLLIITRTHYNFNYLIKPYPKYAGKIFTDHQNAEKMAAELPIHKPLITYTQRAKFMSNFLQLSYAPDPSESLAAVIAPWTTAFSLISGLLCGIISRSFIGGLSSFALTACMSIPMIALIAVNLPLRRLCKASLRSGAMITGYETVKQFCDTNAIMIDSSQLYPKGSVTLSGMRSFKQSKLNDALQAGAAIMYAVNGTMIHVFENIVQCSKSDLPRVENVIYESGLGLVGWVKDQRVLIGNRALLEAHNIEPPEQEMEDKYLKRGEDVMYISVGGDLIAMFILSYKTNKNIANELKALEQNGVNFIIRTVDPNLTREKVAERFGLFFRCITILPTGLGNICHDAMTKVNDRSRAYLVTRGSLSSFAKAVAGCIQMKSGVTISNILQCAALGLGLLIVTMISFVSGFEKLGCLEMLIYIGSWSVISIITSMIKK